MIDYTGINSKTWDAWAKNGNIWSIPIAHDIYADAEDGKWNVVLTPCRPVPKEWFAPFIHGNRLDGAKLLGLACGGGQQMPIFAAIGAECTVLDYSDSQLESERVVAAREGYNISIVKADMTRRLPFEDESFDIIFHPVSNCYIEDVQHVWNECFRVLKPGGVLLSGLDNGFNFLVEDFTVRPLVIANKLPYNPLKMPEERFRKMVEDQNGVQFSHTMEEQIGGQLKAGLILTDVFEDFNNDPDAISDGIPAYWASRAVKPLSSKDGVISFKAMTLDSIEEETCCSCCNEPDEVPTIGEYVCYCNHVKEQDIVDAMARGADMVEKVIQMTGAMKNSNCAVNNPKGTCCYSDIVYVFNKHCR